MPKKSPLWKKGRGKLGVLDPLLGTWLAKVDTPMGKARCSRTFTSVLGDKYVQLDAKWDFGKFAYHEHAIYGVVDGKLTFWSFTSDGKRSEGVLADGKDIHPEAICFEAQMPAGLARMVYSPNEDGSMTWAVEAKNKKGWKRFTEHRYVKG